MRTHYHNLKISENASPDEIRLAYKRLCQQYHPDKHQNSPESERVFGLIHQAYETLIDPRKRAQHNRSIRKNKKKPSSTRKISVTELNARQQIAYRRMQYGWLLDSVRNSHARKESIERKRKRLKKLIARCGYTIALAMGSSVLAFDSENDLRFIDESVSQVLSVNPVVQETAGTTLEIEAIENSTADQNSIDKGLPVHRSEKWVEENIF